MDCFKIGVITDSFRVSFVESLKKASEYGANGIQIYATDGEMSPENLSISKIKEINDIVKSNGLVVSALCGDLGGHGFTIAEENTKKIEKSKRIINLALELGTKVVTTHVGVIPAEKNSSRREVMHKACVKLAEYAELIGGYFAIETGPEPAIVLKSFLDDLGSKGVGVNLDPANLVMVTGDDPIEAVFTLKDYIVHTHAKDGIMVKKTDPEIIYNFFAEGGIDDFRLNDYFLEVPLGEGNVDFDKYLAALNSIGYHGFLTIEREVGENPDVDIKKAINFLKSKNYYFN
jgi:L-ribulose-5-phosphate 3-epimerase